MYVLIWLKTIFLDNYEISSGCSVKRKYLTETTKFETHALCKNNYKDLNHLYVVLTIVFLNARLSTGLEGNITDVSLHSECIYLTFQDNNLITAELIYVVRLSEISL